MGGLDVGFDADFDGKTPELAITGKDNAGEVVEFGKSVPVADNNAGDADAGGGAEILFSAARDHVGDFTDGIGEVGVIGRDRDAAEGLDDFGGGFNVEAENHGADDLPGDADDGRDVIGGGRGIFAMGRGDADVSAEHGGEDFADSGDEMDSHTCREGMSG